MVKIELAGNQRPQEELAYRKLPPTVTSGKFFPMYYMDHAETGWFYIHSKKHIITRQPRLQFVWLGRKGMERLFLFSTYQQSRKDPRRCFVHCISKFQLLSFKIKTLKCFSQHKASKQSQQNSNRYTTKQRCRTRLQWFYSYEGALFIAMMSHLLRSLHAVSLQKYYIYFHCAMLIEHNSILLNQVYSYRQSLPIAF